MTDYDDELPEAVIRLAGRHNLPAGEVHEVPGGVANRGFAIGRTRFVRVARPGFEADLQKETIIVPAARALGVRTPAILEYDDTCTVVPAPYLVMERVHGVEPATTPVEIATDLARLHSTIQAPPAGQADSPAGGGPGRGRAGYLKSTPAGACWQVAPPGGGADWRMPWLT